MDFEYKRIKPSLISHDTFIELAINRSISLSMSQVRIDIFDLKCLPRL